MKRTIASLIAIVGLVAGGAHAQGGIDANGQCVGDANGDAEVTVDELVAAVNNSLNGCPQRALALQFRAVVGDQDYVCGEVYEGLGTTKSPVLATDFRLYVSNVRLVTPEGGEVPLTLDQTSRWQLEDIALLDFEDGCSNGTPQTNAEVLGTVPPGLYSGIRFSVGVPFERNHGNAATAPRPLSVAAMFWSWQGGYKFIRIDAVNPTIPPAGKQVRVHLGSTGCQGDPPREPVTSCTRPNRMEVDLDGFDPDANVILVDLRALYADSDLETDLPDDVVAGCMSDPGDPDCVPVFGNLGVNPEDGSADPSKQTFFRVE